MEFVITGVSHKTLPIHLRERLAVANDRRPELLQKLRVIPGVEACLLLSTCNRTEVHATVSVPTIEETFHRLLCRATAVNPHEVDASWYVHREEAAIAHLFRLAAGLDSMVVGETQIFGQLKDAYRAAHAAGTAEGLFAELLHRAFFVAKRVHTETGVGSGSLSVSSVAVELIERSVCSRHPLTLLVAGAGKVGTTAAKSFRDRDLGRLIIMNRTEEKAEQLASLLGGEAANHSELQRCLLQADAVISCIGSSAPLFSRALLAEVMAARAGRPLFMVDLGVPRDIDPTVAELVGVTLANIDDLQVIAARNRVGRATELARAEQVVTDEAVAAMIDLMDAKREPTIAELMRKCEAIRRRELERTLGRLPHLAENDRALIATCTASIVKKIFSEPLDMLRAGKGDGHSLELLRAIFRLDTDRDR